MARTGVEYLNSPAKRRLDVLGGIAIAALVSPVAVGAAVTSSIDNRSLSPFFKQKRVGMGGEPIEVTKFRTIPERNITTEPETFGTFDPRASRVGLFMRELGVDEIPQLDHVIRGEMSLVGLRPLLQEDLDQMEDSSPRLFRRWHAYYDHLRPGLTGPSQILRHQYKELNGGVWEKVMELDLDYVKEASLRNDLRILGSTPLKLINARMHVIETPLPEAEPEQAAA